MAVWLPLKRRSPTNFPMTVPDPEVIKIDREKDDWDSTPLKGSKGFKVFMGCDSSDGFTARHRCRERECPCQGCRVDPRMLHNETCPYEKWIGKVTDQPVNYTTNPGKVAATSGAVRMQESTKVAAIDSFATRLIAKFGIWRKKSDWGNCDPVIAFGAGGAKFDLARLLSKPLKASKQIQRGVGRDKWYIKKGDWYAKVQWLRCTDEDNQLYVDAEEDLALLSAIVHTDTGLSVEMWLLPSQAMRVLVIRRRGKAASLPLQKRRWQARRARTSTTTTGVALSISGNSLPPTPPQGAGRSRQGGGLLSWGGFCWTGAAGGIGERGLVATGTPRRYSEF